MKIAFVVDSFPKLSETFILNQITGLIDRGHEVDIYANDSGGELKVHSEVEIYNLLKKTYYFNIPNNQAVGILNGIKLSAINFYKNPVVLLRTWNKAKYDKQKLFLRAMLPHMTMQFLQKPSYDIIHCHFGWNGLKGTLLKDIGLLQGKLVTTFHGCDITTYPHSHGEQVYSRLFEVGDLFLPISDLWKCRLNKLGCSPEKVVVHRMGIDCEKFVPTQQSSNYRQEIRLTTVARLVEKKGVEYGIRAVASLIKTHPSIRYVIIGDGELRENLQQLIHQLNVAKNIQLLGWKQQEEVIEILRETDVLIAPSITSRDGDQEGIPVGLMEAMAMGIPIVSTQHSGIPELIQDGVTGFLVSERDSEALAKKLICLIENVQICHEMGQAGCKYVEHHYNIRKLNDRLVELYQNLLTKN